MKKSVMISGSPGVAISCFRVEGDDPVFASWNHTYFNHVAKGRWSEWVALAKRIIEEDERDRAKARVDQSSGN